MAFMKSLSPLGVVGGAAAKNPLSLISPAAALLSKKQASPSLLNKPTSVGSTSKSSIMY